MCQVIFPGEFRLPGEIACMGNAMPIIGLDPSLTHFGWVVLDEKKTGKESLIDFGTFKTTPKDGLMVQRLTMQQERLRFLLEKTGVTFVAMEAPYWEDFNTEILFALNQFIHQVFLDMNIVVVYFQPMALKKVAVPDTNPQKVTKHHVTHAAKTELDKHGKRFSEHVSDAYFAAKIGCRFYRWYILKEFKDDALSEYERHVFCGKHTFTRGKKKGLTEYTGLIYRANDQFFDYSIQRRKTADIKKEIRCG
jgi:Holliday junction resolvasome RuvABC endonuclease subunit